MHCLYRTVAIVVFVLYSFSSVQCQGTLRDEVRANLTRMLQFVVHPSAQASDPIIDHALKMGGRPKTITERIGYIEFIKDIARTVPEYMAQFTTTETLLDGSTIQRVDETKFENAVVEKAREYSNRNDTQATGSLGTSQTGSVATGTTGGGAVTGSGSVNTQTSGTQNTGSWSAAPVDPNPVPQTNTMMVDPNEVPQANTMAGDGTISLLDLFAAMDRNNQELMLL